MPDITVAIMAGGKSTRMGTDKALVSLLGRPMIEHVLERVSGLGQQKTLLVSDKRDTYAYLGLPVVEDIIPNKGPLGGLHSALVHSRTAYTVALACDMPLLNPDLLRYMITLCTGPFDVIAPRVKGHPQGLHAIYSKACLGPILDCLLADRLKLISFYGSVRARYVDEPEYARFDPTGRLFDNINTPEQLEAVREIMAKRPPDAPD